MQQYSPITLGKRLTRIQTNGFVLTETTHQPNLSLKRHIHKNANLVCVMKGSFTEKVGNREFECVPHSLLLKPAGEFHSNYYHKSGAHSLIIEIQSDRLNYFSPQIFDQLMFSKSGDYFSIVRRIYREFSIADSVTQIAVEGLTLELVATIGRNSLSREKNFNSAWLQQAKDFIHEHFSEQLSLSKVAETVSVHPSHLARAFRQKFHSSVGDYIRKMRLDFAAEQLSKTKKSVAEISVSAGFYDQSHFTHAFKNRFSVTPTDFRANN